MKRKPKPHRATDCGHGRVVNPCAVRIDPFVACQACARMVMLERGGIIMAAIPLEAIPPPGATLTLHRAELGEGNFTFVYRAPEIPAPASAERSGAAPAGPASAARREDASGA